MKKNRGRIRSLDFVQCVYVYTYTYIYIYILYTDIYNVRIVVVDVRSATAAAVLGTTLERHLRNRRLAGNFNAITISEEEPDQEHIQSTVARTSCATTPLAVTFVQHCSLTCVITNDKSNANNTYNLQRIQSLGPGI